VRRVTIVFQEHMISPRAGCFRDIARGAKLIPPPVSLPLSTRKIRQRVRCIIQADSFLRHRQRNTRNQCHIG
jgi:hypothetical protein